jgi:hypothetical protein
MDHALTRRGLLAGMGVAAGAAALGTAMAPAGAAPARLLEPSGLDPAALTPGLAYAAVDGTSFTPRDFDNAWPRSIANQGANLSAGGTLVAPLVLPVGSVLKEVTLYYLSTPASNAQVASIQRKPFLGAYDALATPVTLPKGDGMLAYTWAVNEPVNGTATYAVFVNTFDVTQLVGGMLIGYTPAPTQAFIPLPSITRVLDTRTTGGKLAPNEERVVTLGIPAGARAGVINLTVTETEAAGFVAVFAAGTTYAGNSSINWFGPNQNLANGVICTVDAAGKITIRGGVNKTHVVIDVQGYLS